MWPWQAAITIGPLPVEVVIDAPVDAVPAVPTVPVLAPPTPVAALPPAPPIPVVPVVVVSPPLVDAVPVEKLVPLSPPQPEMATAAAKEPTASEQRRSRVRVRMDGLSRAKGDEAAPHLNQE
jgi:hypothetical protein